MEESNVVELEGRAGVLGQGIDDPLRELLREGARRLIGQAVEAEVAELLAAHSGRVLEDGRAGVVRNGHLPERELQTGIGPVTVRIPKVRARTGEPVTFRSALAPPYVRRTRSLEAALPWLYLKGVSTGEMGGALEALVGPGAKGLSAGAVSRLKRAWGQEYREWRKAPLDADRWAYVWADGVYSGLRAEDAKLCALVVVGVNERGEKRILAIEDGVRESTQSWREVLLGLKSRGMNAPRLAVGDGAMGFWAALEETFPETRQQRCWMHKTMNVLNRLPKSEQPNAKRALHDIWQAGTREAADRAFDLFLETYEPKHPKAAECCQCRMKIPQKCRSKIPQFGTSVHGRASVFGCFFLGGRPRRLGAGGGEMGALARTCSGMRSVCSRSR